LPVVDSSSEVLALGVATPAIANPEFVLCLANSAVAPLGCLCKKSRIYHFLIGKIIETKIFRWNIERGDKEFL
jgi:hypothetical protein